VSFGRWIRHYWPETLLFISVALPWASLFALGLYWLWQSGHVLLWAVGATALGLLAWPASILVRRRANKEARLSLGGGQDAEEAAPGLDCVHGDLLKRCDDRIKVISCDAVGRAARRSRLWCSQVRGGPYSRLCQEWFRRR
jgi:hypothetical protein